MRGGCGFSQKAEALERINSGLKKEFQQKIHDLGMELIKVLDKGFDEDAIYQLVEGEVGIDAIIKFKRKNNLDITDKELDYMISKLS